VGTKLKLGGTSCRLVANVRNRHSDFIFLQRAAPGQLDRVVEPTAAYASSTADGDNMVEVLKFSRETAFTPETIQILAAALDEAWETLRQSGSRLARPAYSRAMREVVAKRIMEMAQRGVQDREELVADALRFVTANYEEPSKLTS
jgi:hypothetical protein